MRQPFPLECFLYEASSFLHVAHEPRENAGKCKGLPFVPCLLLSTVWALHTFVSAQHTYTPIVRISPCLCDPLCRCRLPLTTCTIAQHLHAQSKSDYSRLNSRPIPFVWSFHTAKFGKGCCCYVKRCLSTHSSLKGFVLTRHYLSLAPCHPCELR